MRPNISEFSYGFAVTHELLKCLPGISAAPVFPSLYDEGRTGGGYDMMAKFGTTLLFIQFKLSDRMERRSAAEFRHGLLPVPFYRMHLRPARHSRQHQLLLDLERSGELVYYAAPAFHEPFELDAAFQTSVVTHRSVWIRPSAIGNLGDDGEHHVSFVLGGDAFRCSQPMPLSAPVDSESMIQMLTSAVSRSQLSAEVAVERAIGKLASIAEIDPALGSVGGTRAGKAFANLHPLELLAFEARRVLDAQVYLVRREL